MRADAAAWKITVFVLRDKILLPIAEAHKKANIHNKSTMLNAHRFGIIHIYKSTCIFIPFFFFTLL